MDTLEWRRVWARCGRTWILRDVSLGVAAGETLGLIGTAGAGKTALLRAATGALRTASGGVWLNGRPLRGPGARVLGFEGHAFEARNAEWHIHRCLRGAQMPSRDRDARASAAIQAWDLGLWRDAPLRALPSSIRQRALLAAAWACPADVWLLDNPLAALEPAWKEAWPALMEAWIKREGGAVVMSTNAPEEAARMKRVAILHQGRVAAVGSPARLCRLPGKEEIVVRTVNDYAAAAALSANLRLEAERRPDGLLLRVRHADDVLPGVLSTLGASLETVWVRRPTLKDAMAYHAARPVSPALPERPPRGRFKRGPR